MKVINMAIAKCRLCPFMEFFIEVGLYCGEIEDMRTINDVESIPKWCPLPDLEIKGGS
ncbi:MAG: hypothetical protein A4E27_00281 [Methanobacterium sp. PtaU1.Bin242]|nr:MAG: hypothetical protein A4E27_00281 [Methanobacterium sp. PtaU1.Bin242]